MGRRINIYENRIICVDGIFGAKGCPLQAFTRTFKSLTDFKTEFDTDDICDNGMDRFVCKQEKNLTSKTLPKDLCFY